MAEQQTHGQHAEKQQESENLRQAAEKLDLKGKKVAILVAERVAIDSYREMIAYFGDDDPTSRRPDGGSSRKGGGARRRPGDPAGATPRGSPLSTMTTAFAGSEAVFVCTEPLHHDGIEDEHLVVPAAAAVKAGYPHDLVQTELGEVEPVRSKV